MDGGRLATHSLPQPYRGPLPIWAQQQSQVAPQSGDRRSQRSSGRTSRTSSEGRLSARNYALPYEHILYRFKNFITIFRRARSQPSLPTYDTAAETSAEISPFQMRQQSLDGGYLAPTESRDIASTSSYGEHIYEEIKYSESVEFEISVL